MKPLSEQVFMCEQQGELFERAHIECYDLRVFVPAFMNSPAARGLDQAFDRYQWMGLRYILGDVSDRCGVCPVRGVEGHEPRVFDGADRESAYWMGYLYRFWQFRTDEASREIYRQADYETMRLAYPGFHTLACEMAVDRLKEGCIVRGRDPGRIDYCPDHHLEVLRAKALRLARPLPIAGLWPLEDDDFRLAGFPPPTAH